MDHAEARELLDLAAVEPGGLDRLMAGDTPGAIALAGHLAGCKACMEEFNRLRLSTAVLRDVIATQPPPELRERTLALVAAVGRARGTAQAQAPEHIIASVPAGQPEPVGPGEQVAAPAALVDLHPNGRRRLRGLRRAWLAAAAALIVASAALGGFVVNSMRDTSARVASLQLEGLVEVAEWTIRLESQPDVRHVVLTAASAGQSGQVGSLLFSSASRQIVVVADGLTDPPPDQEYRCWVEVQGRRLRLGRMYMNGDLAYWAGDAAALAVVPAGSVFGVSLADSVDAASPNPPMLSGTLLST